MTFKISDGAYLRDDETREFVKKVFDRKTNPLRMVSASVKTGLLELGPFKRRFDEFRAYEVNVKTGLSFTDFLEYPTYYVEQMLTTLRAEKRAIESRRDAENKALEEGLKGGDQYEAEIAQRYSQSRYR